MNKQEKTTIAIYKPTKELLDKFGNKGETYDDIIKNLIERINERRLKNE